MLASSWIVNICGPWTLQVGTGSTAKRELKRLNYAIHPYQGQGDAMCRWCIGLLSVAHGLMIYMAYPKF